MSDRSYKAHSVEDTLLRPAPYTPEEKVSLSWYVKAKNSYYVGTDEKHGVRVILEKFKACWRATLVIRHVAPLSRVSTKAKEPALWACWNNANIYAAREKLRIPHKLNWGDFDYNADFEWVEPEPVQEKKSSQGKQGKIRQDVVYAPLPLGERDEKLREFSEKMQDSHVGYSIVRIVETPENKLKKFFSQFKSIFDCKSDDIPDDLALPLAKTLTDVAEENRLATAKFRLWGVEVKARYGL